MIEAPVLRGRERLDRLRADWAAGILRLKTPEVALHPISEAELNHLQLGSTVYLEANDPQVVAALPSIIRTGDPPYVLSNERLFFQVNLVQLQRRSVVLRTETGSPDVVGRRFLLSKAMRRTAEHGVADFVALHPALVVDENETGFRIEGTHSSSATRVELASLSYTLDQGTLSIDQSWTSPSFRAQGLQDLIFSLLIEGEPQKGPGASIERIASKLDNSNLAAFARPLIRRFQPAASIPVDPSAQIELFRRCCLAQARGLSRDEAIAALRATPALQTRALFGFDHVVHLAIEEKHVTLVTARRR